MYSQSAFSDNSTATFREVLYTWQVSASLPTDAYGLTNEYNVADFANVSAVDSSFMDVTGLGYLINLFKVQGIANTTPILISWTGKVSKAASTNNVVLEVYNYIGAVWEQKAINTTVAINTPFTLSTLISSSLSNYYDANLIVAVRIYQQV
jgi:hypothetical protein